MYLLKNHVELYHGNYSHIYKRIAEIKSGCYTLDKYFIMGSEATCPKCELKIDTTHSETHTREKLKELFEHYFSHRYKKKCFKFANMRKWILFYFFCSNNFIIIRYKRYYDCNQFLINFLNQNCKLLLYAQKLCYVGTYLHRKTCIRYSFLSFFLFYYAYI